MMKEKRSGGSSAVLSSSNIQPRFLPNPPSSQARDYEKVRNRKPLYSEKWIPSQDKLLPPRRPPAA